jgi:hypothetical protein
MKKFSILFIVLAGILAFASCKKDNGPGNHFTYKGDTYPIDSVLFNEYVLNDGEADEQSIFQFMFMSIDGADTTTLMLAPIDADSQVLSGNYPGILENSTETRGLAPFIFFAASGIFFEDDSYVLVGDGGSLDITNNSGNYTLKFNNISVGIYLDLLDSNDDGDVKYTEVGTVGGSFKGVLEKHIYALAKNNSVNPMFKNVK